MNFKVEEAGKYFKVSFDYSFEMIAAIKLIPGAFWKREEGAWYILKFREKELDTFKQEFGFYDPPPPEQSPERFDKIPPLPELTVDIPLLLKPYPYQLQGIAYMLLHDNVLCGDQPGLGKSQPLTSLVATPDGWKRMGDMKIGDPIIGSDGATYHITGIFPQGLRQVYKITMNDDTTTLCDGDHLWQVRDVLRRRRGTGWIIKKTGDLAKDLIWKPTPSRAKTNRKPALKWEIPLMKGFIGNHKTYIIPPYALGVILGDGYACGKVIAISIPDSEMETADRLEKLLPKCLKLQVNRHPACPQYHITQTGTTRANPWRTELSRLGVNIKGPLKFIPQEYMFGNYDQRLDLLRGLMDTDGSCQKNRTTFHTVSNRLAEDISTLVFSLGGQAIIRTYDRLAKGIEFQVNVRLDICPFYMERKAAAWRPAGRNYASRYIKHIAYYDTMPCQCISVSAPDHLYVTDHFIVTHNTIQSIAAVVAKGNFPCLVICPATLKENWLREWMKVAGRRAMILSDKVKTSWPTYHSVGMCDVFITNYESLTKFFVEGFDNNDDEPLKLKHIRFRDTIKIFRSVIIDEVHKIRNPSTIQSKLTAGIALKKPQVIALSGTSVVNSPQDLWPILCVLSMQRMFGPKEADYIARYCKVGKNKKPGNLKELNYYLNLHCFYRREKHDVLKDLPPKVRQVMYCDITNRREYQHAEDMFIDYLRQIKKCTEEEVARKLRGQFMVKMGILKQISARGKLNEVKQYVDEILESGEKVILFCYLQEMIHAVKSLYPQALTIYGEDSMEGRQRSVDLFQSDSRYQIIVCNYKSGGVGLTLTAASRVGFIEEPWTFADCEQCEDRAHRIGQKNVDVLESIQCTYFLGTDTIDDYCHDIVMNKKTIADMVHGSTEVVQMDVVDQLLNLFTKKRQPKKEDAF